jgi:hypothetical protein
LYRLPQYEENGADASAKVPLAYHVLQVWDSGSLTADEALRALYGVLSGTIFTPFGTQLREAQAKNMRSAHAPLDMRGDWPEPPVPDEMRAEVNGGPVGLN